MAVTNTSLIAKHLKIENGNEKGICKICGCETQNGILAKNVIKDARFTNFDELKAVTSNVVCEFCACCMKEPAIRRSSFIADEEKIIFLKNNDVESYIFSLRDKIKIPFVICITKSFKKHMSFKAKVNYSYEKFTVQEEDIRYQFDAKKMKKVFDVLKEMYLHFSKNELLTGDYIPFFLEKYVKEYGYETFVENEKVLASVRGSKAFDLCVCIMNSEAKKEFLKGAKKK